MKPVIIQLITAFIGSMGFAMLFNVNKKYIIQGAAGGLIGWAIYLICESAGMSMFVSSVITGIFCSAFAEIMARIMEAPAIIFYIPAVVPLIPGSSLYYTVSNAVAGNAELFRSFGFATIQYTFGIAAGITVVSAVIYMVGKTQNNH